MNRGEKYEEVIGLEVHAQLLTETKLFCGDSFLFGATPNTQVSPVSLAHPGTLPKMNKKAIELALKLGLATNCEIARQNYFARKNYFYPDLPKGYQISQHTAPVCINGYLQVLVNNENRSIRINRIHIEEDAGKSIHDDHENFSSIDLNRAGTPLVEIVTEPDIKSSEEAAAYVTELRNLVRYLLVCDGNMEEGSFRCDVNISIREKGMTELGTKVEIKNLNSIRFIKKAIEFEKQRLITLAAEGRPILQETRGFDEHTGMTYTIRVKEDADDYRYFADPDLPPFYITEKMIEEVRSEMPPSQKEKKASLIKEYGLTEYDAHLLISDKSSEQYFLDLVSYTSNYKAAANWVLNPIKNWLYSENKDINEFSVTPQKIAELINLIDTGTINYGIATQKVFPQLNKNPSLNIRQFIDQNDLFINNSEADIDAWIEIVLNKHPQKITEYKKGKKGLLLFFAGEVIKLSRGKAKPEIVKEKLTQKLKN